MFHGKNNNLITHYISFYILINIIQVHWNVFYTDILKLIVVFGRFTYLNRTLITRRYINPTKVKMTLHNETVLIISPNSFNVIHEVAKIS